LNYLNGIPGPIEPNSLMELLKKQRLMFHNEARLDPVFFPEAEAAAFPLWRQHFGWLQITVIISAAYVKAAQLAAALPYLDDLAVAPVFLHIIIPHVPV
jgi:hypothetical protein